MTFLHAASPVKVPTNKLSLLFITVVKLFLISSALVLDLTIQTDSLTFERREDVSWY